MELSWDLETSERIVKLCSVEEVFQSA